jgi:hypothetical protein
LVLFAKLVFLKSASYDIGQFFLLKERCPGVSFFCAVQSGVTNGLLSFITAGYKVVHHAYPKDFLKTYAQKYPPGAALFLRNLNRLYDISHVGRIAVLVALLSGKDVLVFFYFFIYIVCCS